ncbi:MetQ/NlpA family ABC transporter substrate-binding protein [Anaerococcus sp. mt242]|uniref:MetQ/NlpA family ABC transporter substrate-binding protein n=1 Tax=Anaerococcus sp. mt242 TaxID=2661917 RepID=UPI001931656B|nr:MetQ/NlpA family ABC transporter substrate-binding protein [Anaerococcus sp. mt242]MBM0046483.1 MetQ/NlpA family ABC transporter substrate-binding protein [Anaerococcus sp. mt242]
MKKLGKLTLGLALALGLSSCGANNANESADTNTDQKAQTETSDTIKIGVVGEKNEVWDEVIKRYEEGTGKKAELVKFSDYTQPNEALLSGDIDVNSYQHYKFLNEFNDQQGEEKIVSIGDTMLAPLGFYSNQIANLDELKDGDRVAISNDPSNGPRALFLLQSAGIIKVNGKPGESITLDDITENPKNLEFIEMDPAQTARALDDVVAAAINDNFALDSGLSPKQDAIYLEDPEDPDAKIYVNVIASRKEDKDNEAYKELVKYYQTDETKADYDKYTKGAWVPAW